MGLLGRWGLRCLDLNFGFRLSDRTVSDATEEVSMVNEKRFQAGSITFSGVELHESRQSSLNSPPLRLDCEM